MPSLEKASELHLNKSLHLASTMDLSLCLKCPFKSRRRIGQYLEPQQGCAFWDQSITLVQDLNASIKKAAMDRDIWGSKILGDNESKIVLLVD